MRIDHRVHRSKKDVRIRDPNAEETKCAANEELATVEPENE
jgi:hypothetical protein